VSDPLGGLPARRPDQYDFLIPSGTAPGSTDVVRARQVIVGGTNGGVFVYSGAPAAGNLITSVAGAAGTDPYGNAFLAGTTSYLAGATYSASSVTGGSISWYTAPGFGGPWTFRGSLTITLSGTPTLLLNFSALGGAINVPQPAIGGTPLASPAPTSYGVVWGTQVVTAINNIVSTLQAAAVNF
jgi:hypothetical protein